MEGPGKEQKDEGGDEEGRRAYPLAASEYRLLEEIGRGAACTVYSALCVPYNQLVAIKVLQFAQGVRISVPPGSRLAIRDFELRLLGLILWNLFVVLLACVCLDPFLVCSL